MPFFNVSLSCRLSGDGPRRSAVPVGVQLGVGSGGDGERDVRRGRAGNLLQARGARVRARAPVRRKLRAAFVVTARLYSARFV